MSEPIDDVNAYSPEPLSTDTSHTDAVIAKLKELLKVAGHDVDVIFDDAVKLAKKLV